MNRPPRWTPLALVLAVAVAWPGAGVAQVSADARALAESLFREGRRLMQQGEISAACPKFAESYRLDATLGTLLNLAVCHEQQGKTATAWAEFREVAVRAARNGEQERASFARTREAALEARLSQVLIRVVDPPPGLELKLDGRVLGEAAWATPIPVDPGDHRIEASAPGRQPWSAAVSVRPGPDRQPIEVPRLAAIPHTAPAVAQPRPELAPVSPARDLPSEPAPATRGRVVAAAIAAAVGTAGLGVGTYFGLRTFSRKEIVERECEGPVCSREGLAADRDAHSAARWSNIGFGTAVVGLGAAAYLWLTASNESSDTAGWRVLPLALDGPGLIAGRRW